MVGSAPFLSAGHGRANKFLRCLKSHRNTCTVYFNMRITIMITQFFLHLTGCTSALWLASCLIRKMAVEWFINESFTS